MRAPASFLLALGIAFAACGGNVVVDGQSQSTTSTQSAGGSVVTSSTSSSGTVFVSCPNQTCGSGTSGSCQCEGLCTDGHSRSVTCTPIPPEAQCSCAQDMAVIGTCTTPPDQAPNCDLHGSCCDALFFGGPGGDGG